MSFKSRAGAGGVHSPMDGGRDMRPYATTREVFWPTCTGNPHAWGVLQVGGVRNVPGTLHKVPGHAVICGSVPGTFSAPSVKPTRPVLVDTLSSAIVSFEHFLQTQRHAQSESRCFQASRLSTALSGSVRARRSRHAGGAGDGGGCRAVRPPCRTSAQRGHPAERGAGAASATVNMAISSFCNLQLQARHNLTHGMFQRLRKQSI